MLYVVEMIRCTLGSICIMWGHNYLCVSYVCDLARSDYLTPQYYKTSCSPCVACTRVSLFLVSYVLPMTLPVI
jgi:hypothetical protein